MAIARLEAAFQEIAGGVVVSEKRGGQRTAATNEDSADDEGSDSDEAGTNKKKNMTYGKQKRRTGKVPQNDKNISVRVLICVLEDGKFANRHYREP